MQTQYISGRNGPTIRKKFQLMHFYSGFQNDDFCEFHTSKEEGPCFPDYKIRHGTID